MPKSRQRPNRSTRPRPPLPVLRSADSDIRQAIGEWVALQRADREEELGFSIGIALRGMTGNGLPSVAHENVARLLFGLVKAASLNAEVALAAAGLTSPPLSEEVGDGSRSAP